MMADQIDLAEIKEMLSGVRLDPDGLSPACETIAAMVAWIEEAAPIIRDRLRSGNCQGGSTCANPYCVKMRALLARVDVTR